MKNINFKRLVDSKKIRIKDNQPIKLKYEVEVELDDDYIGVLTENLIIDNVFNKTSDIDDNVIKINKITIKHNGRICKTI